jgi:hypothetical protein
MVIALEYEFIIVYEPSCTHVVADALFKLSDIIELTRVFHQIIDVALFMLQPEWLKKVSVMTLALGSQSKQGAWKGAS